MAHNEQKPLDWLQRWQLLLAESNINGTVAARGTRVQRLEVAKGHISAQVKDRELGAHVIDIRWPPLNDREWGLVVEKLATHAHVAAQLAAGEVSLDIEGLFHDTGYDLLPYSLDDWSVDYSAAAQKKDNPTESDHAKAESAKQPALKSGDRDTLLAAVYQMLGTALQDDPWLILRLRGRDRQQLVDDLHTQRTTGQTTDGGGHPAASTSAFDDATWGAALGTPTHPESSFFYADRGASSPHDELAGRGRGGATLEDSLDSFWGAGKRLRSTQHHIAPPPVAQALLRRLGPPNFAEDGDTTYEVLSAIYQRVTHEAMLLAYADDGE